MRRLMRKLPLAPPLLLLLLFGWGLYRVSVGVSAELPPAKPAATAWTTAVDPKPLSVNVNKGLAWLVEHQLAGGGWGQGEESPQMSGGDKFVGTPDVADTCIAALALVRSGSTPREGPYKDALARAVRFVRAEVEASDATSLAVTKVQGTRVQGKLGPNIDTFLAALLLAEVKGKMPDEPASAAVDLALNKVIDKIKKNQKQDGSWDNQRGWAPVIAEALCDKGLNRAAQNGAVVPPEVLAKAEKNAQDNFAMSLASAPTTKAARAGGFSAGRPVAATSAGSAGVELYARAANIGVLQDSVNTSQGRVSELEKKAKSAQDASERTLARDELKRIGQATYVCQEAQSALLGRLDDAQFVAGFGSNGGEEFLSYMNISESLVVKGGLDWKRWDDAMTSNLDRIQNSDGSWSGHHCITGRTFCTASALLVLMADRTPVPVKPPVDAR